MGTERVRKQSCGNLEQMQEGKTALIKKWTNTQSNGEFHQKQTETSTKADKQTKKTPKHNKTKQNPKTQRSGIATSSEKQDAR